jgi:tetratricopeptide (TPR) repeat protein
MKANLESSRTANELAYEKLVTAIEASRGTLALLIAVCDDPVFRDRIIQQYEQELKPDFETYRLRLAKAEPSLRATLGSWAEQQSQPPASAILTVTGAEDLLWLNIKDEDGSRTEVEKFFGYLQWGREGLREFPYPVVLWITPRISKQLSLKAPDFWSWRKGVFRFISDKVSEPSVPNHDRDVSLSFSESDPFLLPLEDLQELIAATEQREGTEAPLLGTLYGRLAQVYQRRIERGEAKKLQEERNFAIENYQKAIALQTKLRQDSALIQTLIDLGYFYLFQGMLRESVPMFQQSLQIAQTTGDRLGEANSLIGLGNAYQSLGQYPRAIEYYEQSLAMKREIGDRLEEASSLIGLGNAYQALGQYPRAIEYYEQSLAMKREIGDRNGEGNSLMGLGNAYQSLGQYPRAIEYHEQSLAIQREIGDRLGAANSFGNLGNAYQSSGQYPRAIEHYEQSLAIQREIGNRNGEAYSLNNLGNAYFSLGQYLQAIEYYEQSLAMSREMSDRKGAAASWFNLGAALSNLNRIPDAIGAHRNARQLYSDMELEAMVQNCDEALQRLLSTPEPPHRRNPSI